MATIQATYTLVIDVLKYFSGFDPSDSTVVDCAHTVISGLQVLGHAPYAGRYDGEEGSLYLTYKTESECQFVRKRLGGILEALAEVNAVANDIKRNFGD